VSVTRGAGASGGGSGTGVPRWDIPAGLAVLDGTGRVIFIDADLASLLGQEVRELVGKDIFRFVEENQRPAARQALRRAARTGRVGPAVWLARGAGPRRFIMSLEGRSLAGSGGEPLYVVTARARPQRHPTLHRQALLASIAQECDEAIMSSGAGGTIEIWNHAAAELFGWEEKDALRAPVGMIVPPDREAEASDLMRRAWAGEVLTRVETVRMCRQGTPIEVSISLAPVRDRWGRVSGVSQVIRDITQQKASERALAYQAMHDHLTGLPNRGLLEDRMGHALERCRREGHRIGVVFFDLDHFKNVNDTAGHEVGDRLLRAVAMRLCQSVRSMDTVARMGGDEFVILCEDITDDAQLDVIVAHIMAAFANPVVLPDRQLWVSVSAGVVSGDASSSVAELLSHADAAMYQAKERARGSVGRYDPKTRPDLERRAEWSRLLRLAIEARQLVPYYQPIVDLHSGTIVAVEALARWEDPVRGLVEAKDFIPLAQEIGLLGDITDLVLGQAARAAMDWVELAPALKVTVNVSPLQLRNAWLAPIVRRLVEGGVDPAHIVLEITESALVEDAVACGPVLRDLRDAGFGLAIDDFGTGYSSLAYLNQLPATSIKVDQAFTAKLADRHDLSIVMAILAIADAYGLSVVAEGVETLEQAEVLRSLGCQDGQGYHFGRPMPAEAFSRLLRQGRSLPDKRLSLPDQGRSLPAER
jgi:diguanylate cyclase (GGDEF)-like protein/PAS domain S-box-containing protein